MYIPKATKDNMDASLKNMDAIEEAVRNRIQFSVWVVDRWKQAVPHEQKPITGKEGRTTCTQQ